MAFLNTKVMHSDEQGFTLIELLVVISIIGLLSSITIGALSSARAKGRDAQRTLAIKQVQTALELYYNDNNQYPSSADVPFPGPLTAALTTKYISAIPVNPISSNPYRYYTNSMNPATFYAIFVPYETKPVCYMCQGPRNLCAPGLDYWGFGTTMCN